MEKFMKLFDKYADLVLAIATAYWLVVGLIGDLFGIVFAAIHLYFLIRLVYIAVGLVGVIKLIQMFKPELLNGKKK